MWALVSCCVSIRSIGAEEPEEPSLVWVWGCRAAVLLGWVCHRALRVLLRSELIRSTTTQKGRPSDYPERLNHRARVCTAVPCTPSYPMLPRAQS